jgi:hypothetical protein
MAFGKLTRRNTKQQVSQGAFNGNLLQDIGEDAVHEMDVTQRRNGRKLPSQDVQKIDWEIPRKLFHSSIGSSHRLVLIQLAFS